MWIGELISQTGHQITTVALLIRVDRLTGSTAAVGAIGLVQLLPMIITALAIGPVIDTHDRRRALLWPQLGLTGAAALNAILLSVAMPTRSAMTPNLVPSRLLPTPATAPPGAGRGRGARHGRRAHGPAVLKGNQVLQSTFTVDIVAMVFGMPRALFPVLARKQVGRGPEAVGWLFSAVAVGALLGALASGWVVRIRRQGPRC